MTNQIVKTQDIGTALQISAEYKTSIELVLNMLISGLSPYQISAELELEAYKCPNCDKLMDIMEDNVGHNFTELYQACSRCGYSN